MNVIDTAKELIAIPSPLGETSALEEYVAERVGRTGEVTFVPVEGKGRCVVSSIRKDERCATIVINGHMDTVQACKGWNTDPFEPVVEGDRLYGLGSADMKSGLAVAMELYSMLASKDVNVTFTASVDEEGESAGAFALLESGIKGDLCLIPEPTNLKVMLGCRGRYVFDVRVGGRSAHGARPDEGVNAIEETGRFVAALSGLELPEHELLGRGSVTVLEISGGIGTLSVPEACMLKLDRHYVEGETVDDITKAFTELVGKIGSKADFRFCLNRTRRTPFLEPYITSDTGIVADFCRTAGKGAIYGRSVGDYNAFAKVMPTVVYGPVGVNWHAANEYVQIPSIKECLEAYSTFVDSLSSQTEKV